MGSSFVFVWCPYVQQATSWKWSDLYLYRWRIVISYEGIINWLLILGRNSWFLNVTILGKRSCTEGRFLEIGRTWIGNYVSVWLVWFRQKIDGFSEWSSFVLFDKCSLKYSLYLHLPFCSTHQDRFCLDPWNISGK